MTSLRYNEKLMEIMEYLSSIMIKHGEPFRAKAYQKALETIMIYPNDILNTDCLKGKPGIGPTIIEKLNEYITTGSLKIIEKEKANPVNILADIYGVGPKKAKELVDLDIYSIEKLRENQHLLNDVQKVGLKYYEDVLKRIPRSEIEEYEIIINKSFNKIKTTDSRFQIVGSYRRGAENSGDIDIIITSNDQNIFINFIDELKKENIIVEILSRGLTKCLVMAKIPNSELVRRVDFLYTSLDEFPFAILYFTGSKIFNTVMRHIALEKGYTMNEHGIYYYENKKKGNKVNEKFQEEKDIFHFLGLVYKEPIERKDGRAIEFIKKNTNIIENNNKLINENMNNMNNINNINNMNNIINNKNNKKKTLKNKKNTLESDSKIKNKIIIEMEKDDVEDLYIINIKNTLQIFKKNGISLLHSLNEEQISNLVNECNKDYYYNKSLLSDNEFDIIKEYLNNKFPNNLIKNKIGAPICNSSLRKVSLPYYMGSMDKIKPDTGMLEEWKYNYKGPYLISCKLDGVSGLYSTENNEVKLYTRGDGEIGQDISHLIPYLKLPLIKELVIRGEFIINKKIFEQKYKNTFANPRNMVAGIINNKTINISILRDISFVAYELIKPIIKPSLQMEFLSTLNIDVVLNKIKKEISNDVLSSELKYIRNNYQYEIDGIIVTNDEVYNRCKGNPKYSFAFKMILSDQLCEAKVVDVIWTPSKDGYLKPRVQIEPIKLGGVTIEYATGFNASFINNNSIGIGAIVEIIRSGDVIPHIQNVISKAEFPKMPQESYKWTESKVDIILLNMDLDETVIEKNITCFFKGIGVEGLGSGNILKLIKGGYNTIEKIIKMDYNEFLTIDGFKEKSATKFHNGIKECIEKVSLILLISSSNIFGRGFSDKKIEIILSSYPDVLISEETNLQKINKISGIKGMALNTAEKFVENFPEFIQFIKNIGQENKLKMVENLISFDEKHLLYNKNLVMSGFRNNKLEESLKNIGCKLGSTVTKNTFLLLVKDLQDESNKIIDAKALNISIMKLDEFINKYNF